MAPTRRDRRRRETITEIKDAAWRQIAVDGAPALSLRAVGRAIGMSPAGLYRYYDGRDALLTALLVDAYDDLADAVEEGIAARRERPGTWADAFVAGALAYRRWAVDHPNRFLLIFGTPVPGYAAPEGGPTVEANTRVGQALLSTAAQGFAAGELPDLAPPADAAPAAVRIADQLGAMIGRPFPVALVERLIGTWAHLHGLVILEITNQLGWLVPDAGPFIEREAARMVAALQHAQG